jgi:hypothetical protein
MGWSSGEPHRYFPLSSLCLHLQRKQQAISRY